MELGRLGLDGPTRREASGRAAWRPGLRTGAERSTGLGCASADDSEDEEQRAAGGPGPKSWIRPGSGELTGWMTADFARLRERTSHVSSGHMGCIVTTEPVQDRSFLDRSFQICRLDAQHSNKGIKGRRNGSC